MRRRVANLWREVKSKEPDMGRPVTIGIGTLIVILIIVAILF